MNAVVIYKSKYGSTKAYAQWIAEELSCDIIENKNINVSQMQKYDTVIYGGGLYAEVIAGIGLITKNLDTLSDKKLVVYTTGLTPVTCREYYDKLVTERNFKDGSLSRIKMFNFPGKLIVSELSFVHRTAIKTLKKMMRSKENLSEMEKLLIELCDKDGDFTDKNAISELIAYVRK